jgi:hypothetical protein
MDDDAMICDVRYKHRRDETPLALPFYRRPRLLDCEALKKAEMSATTDSHRGCLACSDEDPLQRFGMRAR